MYICSVKSQVVRCLFATILTLGALARPETVKHSLYIEGTVIGAQRFGKMLKYTTKISFQEDDEAPVVERRRFRGNWQNQINKLRGKRVRLDLVKNPNIVN